MHYEIYGPFELPRDDRRYIHMDKNEQKLFWDDINERHPGLDGACGCYVFATRASKGGRPWYVGKAEKQSFGRECFTPDKIVKYNSALRTVKKGTPVMYLYARITSGKQRISKPSPNQKRDVDYLEKMLIGFALDRNSNLINIKETALLKGMVVPGLINSPRGKLSASAAAAQSVMGY